MGEKDGGVYHEVVMASWLCGALGKSHVRWGSFLAAWNWDAMSVYPVSYVLDISLTVVVYFPCVRIRRKQ